MIFLCHLFLKANRLQIKLFGVRFKISFLFTVYLALITLFDKSGDILYFFAAALVHEAAHLLTMCFLNSKPMEILLIPGGINIIGKGATSSFDEFLILLSGPLCNLICFYSFNGTFSSVSLLLFAYNILPINGLDGGSMLRILLSEIFCESVCKMVINIFTVLFYACLICAFICFFGVGEYYSLIIYSVYMISVLFLKKLLKE